MRCRHCRKHVVSRPRRLCWACFQAPDIRCRYPHSDSPFARRGLGLGCARMRLPALATAASPGSMEKIEVMIERARRRESLFHPADATLESTMLAHAG